jgi:2-polyprenyl-3-methyl-5-hydroxy-6-metoxy-1,4-benzoquinol methylase
MIDIYNDRHPFRAYKQHRLKKILPYIPNKKLRVLDVACGESKLYEALARHRQIEYTGMDLSPVLVEKNKKKKYDVRVHDVTTPFPFPANTFDVVLATEIIEHVNDTDAMLQNIKRVLKKNGILVLTTPNAASLGDRARMLMGRTDSFEYHIRPGAMGHIRYFDIRKMREIMKHNNLTIIKITGRDFYLPLIHHGTPLGFINEALSNVLPSYSAGFIVIAKKT